jgi:hypothetical protein
MTALRVFGLAAFLAAGTWLAGWWMVPAGAAVYAFVRRGTGRPARDAALAAALGWGALLAFQATHPAFGRLSDALTGVFPVPVWALMLISLAFAATLAGLAAALVEARVR